MELLIIRHGQSQGMLEDRHEGRADFELSAQGVEQAEKVARFIYQNYPLERIYSSPLQRAHQTALQIADPLGIPVYESEALTERDNGRLSGMKRSEALEAYPFPESGRQYYDSFVGGESELDQRCRVERFLAELCENPPARRIGLVSHASTINLLFRTFLNLPLNCPVYLSTAEGGIHFWHIHNRFQQIIFNNYQSHL